MVTRFLPSAALLLALSATLCTAAPARIYQVGEKAEHDIKTPVPLVVVDTDATESLRQRESQRVHVIYRYHSHAASESEAAFRSTFDRTRTNFLNAVQSRFGKRSLTAEETESRDFQRFLTDFQRQNILFPVGLIVARTWAQGESDAEMENALAAKLRSAMSSYVRPDSGPKDIWVGSTIRLVSAADNERVSAELVNDRGFNVAKTNFVSVQRTKLDLLNGFPPEERSVAKYLASFVKPNCDMEAELTRTLRSQRTSGLLVADRYQPGQLIVARGDEINRKTKAALDEMNAKLAQVETKPEEPKGLAALQAKYGMWPLAAITAFGLLLVAGIVRKARRRPAAMLPVVAGGSPMIAPGDSDWRERALHAEQQVAQARHAARTGIVSQLAGWMSSKLTQKLAEDRTQLVDAHQKAAVEVAELEARLEKVQAPLQERLAAYETRIAELEKELVAKDEENRQLIQAKIQIIRRQLELERDKNRLNFN